MNDEEKLPRLEGNKGRQKEDDSATGMNLRGVTVMVRVKSMDSTVVKDNAY